MAGSIDPRLRDNPWDPLACKGRWRVWNSHRGKPSWPAVNQPHLQAGHMDASDPIRPSKNSCGTGAVHIWVPAFAGTTETLLPLHDPPAMHPGRLDQVLARLGRAECGM